jgi:Tol biopolymer transport system component
MTSAVARIMHQTDLPVTPRPTPDVDAAVSPEGKEVAFASDLQGEGFEIYTANVFTGEV